MFTKGIFNTTLTSEVADRLFSNITSIGGLDQSFLATLRALLRNRLPQDEAVNLICKGIFISESELVDTAPSQRMRLILPDALQSSSTLGHNIFIIHTTRSDAGSKMLEIVRANSGPGKRHLSNYARRDELQVFYARKTNALFYTALDGKNTAIFVDKMELKHFHALQMMIPKYLPSLFSGDAITINNANGSDGSNGSNDISNSNSSSNNPSNFRHIHIPLTQPETTLLKSTGNKSAVEYERLIEEFAKDLDIRSEIIRTKLAGFESVFERIRADELRDEIKANQDNYNYHLAMMRDISNNIQERRYTLAGLESTSL